MDAINQQNKPFSLPHNMQKFTISGKEKSMLAAFLLTLIIGPAGLFFASLVGGVIMTLIGALIFLFCSLTSSFILMKWALIFVWIVSMIWSYNAAKKTIKNDERRLMFRNAESVLY